MVNLSFCAPIKNVRQCGIKSTKIDFQLSELDPKSW